eukprot:451729-Rhodomonas_salina.4
MPGTELAYGGPSLHVLLQEIELAQAAFHTCKAEALSSTDEGYAATSEAVSAELAGLRQDMESKVAEREMRIAELESQVQECRSSLSSTEQALTAARNDASTLEAELAKMAEQLDQSVHKVGGAVAGSVSPMRCPGPAFLSAMRCVVLTLCMPLRMHYAMSGTENAYAATRSRISTAP